MQAASFHHGEAIGFLLSVIRDIKPRIISRNAHGSNGFDTLAMMHFTNKVLRIRTFH